MSNMTITEKILAKHANKAIVHSGDNVWIDIDTLMTHDVCGPGTIGLFKKHFGENAKVWNRDKIVIIPDHYIFTEDSHARRNIENLRKFVKEQQLSYFYDVGSEKYKGVCHVALAEEGFTRPGEILIGTDSHTCTAGAFGMFATGVGNTDAAFIMGTGKIWVKVPETMKFIFDGQLPPYIMAKDLILQIIGDIGVDGATYRSMEFSGDAIQALNMDERMTLCNMAIEAGGKNGLVAADRVTETFIKSKTDKEFEIVENDPGAVFCEIIKYNANDLEPVVSKPFLPENVDKAKNMSDIKLDQCYIGSCTGGKITDFVEAAKILKGKFVKVRTVVVPATTEISQKLKKEKIDGETLESIFIKAGVKLGPPSCAACLGGPEDTFGRLNNDETCISTTNRNFPGRMGSKKSKTYLASPITVASSSLTGQITDPREFL